MRFVVAFALAVSGVLPGLPAMAQSASIGGGPAEVPPANYAERFYVDSQGCMFIRAGSAGQVQWVAQVKRNRQPVCGLVPTRAAGTAAPGAVLATMATKSAAVAPMRRFRMPKGYEAAWSDGRLNPQRGPRAAAGDAAMALIWNVNQVPMTSK